MSINSKRGQTAGSRKTQFEKGRSGNPRGRPPKPQRPVPKHLRDVAAAAARERVPVRQGKHVDEFMKIELLMQRAIDHGIREGGKPALDAIRMLAGLLGQAHEPLVDPLVETPQQIWENNFNKLLQNIEETFESKYGDAIYTCNTNDDDSLIGENDHH